MRLFVMVFGPIMAAGAAYLFCRRRERNGEYLALTVTSLVFLCALSLFIKPASGAAGGFCTAAGLAFQSGSMQSVMALLAAFLWLMTALVSPEYFSGARANGRFYMFYLWTLGALMGVFLAADFLTLFIFFEIMSFTSYVWVVQNETAAAIRASETYLFIAVIGGLTMLMGLFLLYAETGTLAFDEVAAKATMLSDGKRLVIGICMLVGFGAKAGMFPLHIWLPKAHPAAPAPASALLSGILTKSGIFGVILVTCRLFASVPSWGDLLLVPAAITMFLGALLAVFSVDLKRTLACSSMSQIGFILTGIAMRALLEEHGAIAASGTMLHVLNHSLIKLTLFVAAGVVYFNVHSLNLNDVRGFGKDKPVLKLAFLSGACSIAGIPGFSGYISKTLLHESIVEYAELLAEHGFNAASYHVVEWVFLASGGLTLAYMARLFYILFIAEKPAHQHQKEHYMGAPTGVVLAIGGSLMPILGLSAHLTMDSIAAYAVPFFDLHPMHHAVEYFSLTNLKGAAISITIGILVFFFVGMKGLTGRENGVETYRDFWPGRLDLEDLVYRPVLRAVAAVGGFFARLIELPGALIVNGSGLRWLLMLGTAAARLVEMLGALLVLTPVNVIFLRAKKTVVPPEDEQFANYQMKRKRSSVDRSFASDLLCAGLGITAVLIFSLFAR